MFTHGIVTFAFATLDMITSKAEAIYQKAKQIVDNLDPASTPPGLLEQYRISLERLRPGTGTGVGYEFGILPSFFAAPSECVFYCQSLMLT